MFSREDESRLDNPEMAALDLIEEERIRQAVRSLPENLRSVVVLYYFEGLSVGEIASALGIGEEGVKSRLFRSRKLLRIFLEDQGG